MKNHFQGTASYAEVASMGIKVCGEIIPLTGSSLRATNGSAAISPSLS